jgi:hypothetical protein
LCKGTGGVVAYTKRMEAITKAASGAVIVWDGVSVVCWQAGMDLLASSC